jgi:hypothetical protein
MTTIEFIGLWIGCGLSGLFGFWLCDKLLHRFSVWSDMPLWWFLAVVLIGPTAIGTAIVYALNNYKK